MAALRSLRQEPSSELELALLAPVQLAAGAEFECPDCTGDPACPTCGEPTRPAVLIWLQGQLEEALA